MEVVESYVSSKQGIFPIKDFVHIALVKGLFCLLALSHDPGAGKIPHIPQSATTRSYSNGQ